MIFLIRNIRYYRIVLEYLEFFIFLNFIYMVIINSFIIEEESKYYNVIGIFYW